MESIKTDAIIITDPYNLRYFTGFRGGEGFSVIAGENKYLIVDSRYTEAAGRESDFEVIEYNNAKPLAEVFKSIVAENNIRKIGFEDENLTVAAFSLLKSQMGEDLEYIPLGESLNAKRRIKKPYELEMLKAAEHIGDMAFDAVIGFIKPGLTELEVAAFLEYKMKQFGANGLSFDTICASGIHSSMPHAIPDDKKLETGDFVTMDFGCIYKGYCSDMTRTVVLGKADEKQKEVYNLVRAAQQVGLDTIKAGMRCCDVDKAARDVIEKAGYGKYFGHGLGHSVGLYIHEKPALNTRDVTVLEAGMIETIEPGVYIPGFGGVRIEDMVAVTEDGCVNFAHSPKELLEL